MSRLNLLDVRRHEDDAPATQLRPPITPVTDEDLEDGLDEAFESKVYHRACYLAGPMRGIEEYNFPAFHKAAADLRSRGWRVSSPAERDEAEGFNPKTDETKSLKDYMVFDLPMVCEADAVIVLPGWEESEGALLETDVAWRVGMPVLLYGDELTEVPQPAKPALFEPHMVDVPPRETVCQEADRLVSTDRGGVYGHPADDFGKVTAMAQGLWGRGPETPEEHALYMILVKLSRLASSPDHRDSMVDVAGYIKTYEMIRDRAKTRTEN